MALEVPTGWFADRFGYRRSLILGSLLQVAGMICCWLADGIPGLVAACLLVAVADAFRSGADQALLYRTCVAIGREPEFQRIEARVARRSSRHACRADRRRRRDRHHLGVCGRLAR